MLSPITPVQPSVAPLEPARPRTDVPPSVPVQPGAGEAAVTPDKRHPQELADTADDRQRRRRQPEGGAPGEPLEEASVSADDESQRQGRLIDVQV
jgi:hypothetical protein